MNHAPHSPARALSLRLVALSALVALGSTLGCDVEDELSEDERLEQELLDEEEAGEPSAEELAFMAEADQTEPYVGISDRIGDLTAAIDPSAFSWKNWHSEETAGASYCGADEVLTGFDCSGSYCDNVRMECHDYGTSVSGGTFSSWFEYGNKSLHICPSGSKITGLDCWGSYCDNLSVRCSSAPNLGTARCAWSDWYSEENPSPFYADVGDAIQGIWCSGTHCDNKRFYVCEAT